MRIAHNYPCCYLYLTVSRVVGIWRMLCSEAFMGRDLQLTLLSQFSLNTFKKIMTYISLEHQKTISEVLVTQLCPTLSDPMDCGLPGFSVHGISQARTLGYFAISSSRGSSWSRDWTFDSCVSCIGKWILYHWVTREATPPFFIKTQMWVHLTQAHDSPELCIIWTEVSGVWSSLLLDDGSVQSVVSDSLRPHGLQHAGLPCPSPTPGAYTDSCPSCRWCHTTISSSVITFSSCLQCFPASGSFPMSQFFTLDGQSIGVSASASVFPMNIQDWFPLALTGWISLQSKELHFIITWKEWRAAQNWDQRYEISGE